MRFYLYLLLLMWMSNGYSAVNLVDGDDYYNLAVKAQYLEDADKVLSFEDIQAQNYQEQFRDHTKNIANFGFNTSAFWFKIPVNSSFNRATDWIFSVEYSLLDYLDLYYQDAAGNLVHKKGGDRRDFSTREVKHRYGYFKVHFEPFEEKILYLRVQTEGSAEIPLALMSPLMYAERDHESQFGQGVFVGLMAIMGAYYFIMGVGSRKLEYIMYSVFVFSLALFKLTMNGVTMEYLWADFIWFTNAASSITTPLTFWAAGAYTYVFLEIKNYRKLKYAFWFFLGLLGSCVVFGPFLPYKLIKVYTLLGLLFDVLLVFSSIYSYRNGFKPAKYFILSWFALISASVVYGLQKFGVIPVSFFTVNCVEISGAFQALVLAVGQTEKINEINVKIREAQKKALEAQVETNRVTEMMKNKLEDLVAERTADLWAKNQDIKVMMDSIKQGICTIDGSFLVRGEYSKYLEEILETGQLKEKSIYQNVFASSDLNDDEKEMLKNTLHAIIGEDTLNFEANQHVFPSQVNLSITDKDRKILELDWAPIENQEDVIEKLLISVRDVTELMTMKEEAAQKEEELQKIGKILRLSATKFAGFIKSSFTLISESQFMLDSSDPNGNWPSVLRNIHTIKGNARTYGFEDIAATVHQVEDYLFSIPKGEVDSEVIARSNKGMDEILDALEVYRDINDNTLERSDAGETEQTLISVTDFLKELSSSGNLDEFTHRRDISSLFDKLNYLTNDSFQKALEPIKESMPSLASQLGKHCPEMIFEGDDFYISKQVAEKYEDMFVHLVRNSLDHGFDADTKSRIFIHIERVGSRRHIKYRDNGRGLNIEKLRQKSSDTEGMSDLEVANKIFEAGVSCSEKVTDISGRGVGMEAVKSFVEDLSGTVTIELGAETKPGYRSFLLIFDVPVPQILEVARKVAS